MGYPKVCVLLSTYNGENYLKEQLDSILHQDNIDIMLLIRDDGSTDNTKKILKEYQEKYFNNVRVIFGKNLGWQFSFFKLLKDSDEFEYYAFSDQDDVWLPKKLERAVSCINKYKKNKEIILYTSNVNVTDEQLNITGAFCGDDYDLNSRPFERSILESGLPGGLTYVFNNCAKSKILELYPGGICGHDTWTFLVCYLFGHVIYDKEKNVLYRQHGNNVIGANAGVVSKIKNKIKTLLSVKNPIRSEIASKLLAIYPELGDNCIIYDFLKKLSVYPQSIKNKMSLIKVKNVRRDSIIETLFLYLKILLSKF